MLERQRLPKMKKCKNCDREWPDSTFGRPLIGNKGEETYKCPVCGDNCLGVTGMKELVKEAVAVVPEPVKPSPEPEKKSKPKKGAKK